jgi:hypothetical protein
MTKEKKPDTRTPEQKMADWRAKRQPIDTPKGKYGWATKKPAKKDHDES